MAELTHLDEKLAEVLGLAKAAEKASSRVAKLAEDSDQRALCERLGRESSEIATRCEAVAGERNGRKTAIEEKARETRQEAEEMMETYLGGKDEVLDGFEFLIMAEAGELGHWEILRELGRKAGEQPVSELVEFALPIEEGHVRAVREAALACAGSMDPAEAA